MNWIDCEEKYTFMKKEFWRHPLINGFESYRKLRKYYKAEKKRLENNLID